MWLFCYGDGNVLSNGRGAFVELVAEHSLACVQVFCNIGACVLCAFWHGRCELATVAPCRCQPSRLRLHVVRAT